MMRGQRDNRYDDTQQSKKKIFYDKKQNWNQKIYIYINYFVASSKITEIIFIQYKGLLNIPKKEVSQKFTFSFISILLLTPIKSFIRQHAKEDEKIDGERLRKRAQLIERIAFLTGRSSRRLERREGSLIKRWIHGHGAKAYRSSSVWDFKSFRNSRGYYFRRNNSVLLQRSSAFRF